MIDEPLLQDVWTGAIYVELGYLAQGYANTKGTDTINFMSLDRILNIPADQIELTHELLLITKRKKKTHIGYILQKGGNLIEYHYKLTLRTADLTTSDIRGHMEQGHQYPKG